MDFVFFWIGSSVFSLGVNFVNELRVIKDLADNGYKFDLKALRNYSRQNHSNDNTYLYFLVPMLNVWYSFMKILEYDNMRMVALDNFRVMGLLKKMNSLELEEYKKRETYLNALLNPLIVQRRLDNAECVRIKLNGIQNEFYYERDKENKLIILQVNGPVEYFSLEEQKKILNNILKVRSKFWLNINDLEDKNEELSVNSDEKNNDLVITNQEIIKNLKSLRDELSDNNLENESNKSLVKKKKTR